MAQYTFTIFTPCYNSEKLIERVFDSLQSQSFKDFEWIVTDDCSTDKTREVIKTLIPKANFPVHFIENETNQMVNKNQDDALKLAKGELFIKLSHDDYIAENGLKNFHDVWSAVDPKEQEKLYGVTLNCCDKSGKLEGDPFPKSPMISNDYKMRFGYKVKGEKCSAQRTELMRSVSFSKPDVDVYVPADLHFYSLNDRYNSVYANKMGRVHVVDENLHVYLENQIGRGQKYTKGISYYFEKMSNELHSKVWKNSKFHHLLHVTNFVRYARYNGDSYASISKRIKHKKFLYPVAVLLGNIHELKKYRTLL